AGCFAGGPGGGRQLGAGPDCYPPPRPGGGGGWGGGGGCQSARRCPPHPPIADAMGPSLSALKGGEGFDPSIPREVQFDHDVVVVRKEQLVDRRLGDVVLAIFDAALLEHCLAL